jgi:hypothetical protein
MYSKERKETIRQDTIFIDAFNDSLFLSSMKEWKNPSDIDNSWQLLQKAHWRSPTTCKIGDKVLHFKVSSKEDILFQGSEWSKGEMGVTSLNSMDCFGISSSFDVHTFFAQLMFLWRSNSLDLKRKGLSILITRMHLPHRNCLGSQHVFASGKVSHSKIISIFFLYSCISWSH